MLLSITIPATGRSMKTARGIEHSAEGMGMPFVGCEPRLICVQYCGNEDDITDKG